MICSPYDVEATYGRKLTTWWVGYKVHLTESCDEDAPRLITHVQTSRAGNGDVDVTPVIHQALQDKDLVPAEHLTDTNYAEAKQFVQSREEYGIELLAPTRADHKWQGKEQQGFDGSQFQIDWQTQTARCPAGKQSLSWTPAIDRYDNQVIKIKFSMKDCTKCSLKAQCTKATRRTITVSVQPHHEALQQARARQKDAAFWEKYRARSGIEGTISEARTSLWDATEPLSWHGENPPAPLDHCNGDQPSTPPGLVRRTTTCQNAHLEIRGFSFGGLSLLVRQQYHVGNEPSTKKNRVEIPNRLVVREAITHGITKSPKTCLKLLLRSRLNMKRGWRRESAQWDVVWVGTRRRLQCQTLARLTRNRTS